MINPELKCSLSSQKNVEGLPAVKIGRDMILSLGRSGIVDSARVPAGHFRMAMGNGDELLCQLRAAKLKLISDFGDIELASVDVKSLRFHEDGRVDVKLWEGSQLSGRLNQPSLDMVMGSVEIKIPVSLISNMMQDQMKLPKDLEAAVAQLITNLDAGEVEERDRAEAVLTRLGVLVRPYLKNAAQGQDLSPELKHRIKAILKALSSESGEAKINLAEIRKKLNDEQNEEKKLQALVVRALKSILKAQKIFQSEDRNNNGLQDFGDLASLAKLVGKDHGIDKALGAGKKLDYLFEAGPSTNERASEHLWWATAKPENGNGPHFFINHTGAIYQRKDDFDVNKATCDRPEASTPLKD